MSFELFIPLIFVVAVEKWLVEDIRAHFIRRAAFCRAHFKMPEGATEPLSPSLSRVFWSFHFSVLHVPLSQEFNGRCKRRCVECGNFR